MMSVEACRAVVHRACSIMGWPYSQSPTWSALREVAEGRAVVISVERLHEILDRIVPRPGLCEHSVPDGEWCEACNRAYKLAQIENGDA